MNQETFKKQGIHVDFGLENCLTSSMAEENDEVKLYLFRKFFFEQWKDVFGKIAPIDGTGDPHLFLSSLAQWDGKAFEKLAELISASLWEMIENEADIKHLCMPQNAAEFKALPSHKPFSERLSSFKSTLKGNLISKRPLIDFWRDNPKRKKNYTVLNCLLWACQGGKKKFENWQAFADSCDVKEVDRIELRKYYSELESIKQNPKVNKSSPQDSWMTDLKQALRSKYTNSPEFSRIPLILATGDIEERTLPLGEYFVDLAYHTSEHWMKDNELIQHEKLSTLFGKEFRMWHGKDYLTWNVLAKHPRAIILGNPGVGKSTFARQTCNQWATGGHKSRQPLIYVNLRDYDTGQGRQLALWNYVCSMYGLELDSSKLNIKRTIQSLYEEFIFLLDGFDELPWKEQLDLVSALNDSPIKFVILSRPHGLVAHRNLNAKIVAEIYGFNLSTRHTYVTRMLSRCNESGILAPTTVTSMIDANPVLKYASYNPLLLSYIMQLLIRDNSSFEIVSKIDSIYELQNSVVDMVVTRALEKEREAPETFSGKIQHSLVFAHDLAFELECKKTMHFQFNNLSRTLPDIRILSKLGLGSDHSSFVKDNSFRFQFLSASLQEYLAANAFGLDVKLDCLLTLARDPYYWNLLRQVVGYLQSNQRYAILQQLIVGLASEKVQDTICNRVLRYLVLGEMCPKILAEVVNTTEIQLMVALFEEVYWMPYWSALVVDAYGRILSKLNKNQLHEFSNLHLGWIWNHLKNFEWDGFDTNGIFLEFSLYFGKIGLAWYEPFIGSIVEILHWLEDKFVLAVASDTVNAGENHFVFTAGTIQAMAHCLLEGVIKFASVSILQKFEKDWQRWGAESQEGGFCKEFVLENIIAKFFTAKQLLEKFDQEWERCLEDIFSFNLDILRQVRSFCANEEIPFRIQIGKRLVILGEAWMSLSEDPEFMDLLQNGIHFFTLIPTLEELRLGKLCTHKQQTFEQAIYEFAWRFDWGYRPLNADGWLEFLESKLDLLDLVAPKRVDLETLYQVSMVYYCSSHRGYFLSRQRTRIYEICKILLLLFGDYALELIAKYQDPMVSKEDLPDACLAIAILDNFLFGIEYDFDRQYFLDRVLIEFDYRKSKFVAELILPTILKSGVCIPDILIVEYLEDLILAKQYGLLLEILSNPSTYSRPNAWPLLLKVWMKILPAVQEITSGSMDENYTNIHKGLRYFLAAVHAHFENTDIAFLQSFSSALLQLLPVAWDITQSHEFEIVKRNAGSSVFALLYLYLLNKKIRPDFVCSFVIHADILLEGDFFDGGKIRMDLVKSMSIEDIELLQPCFSEAVYRFLHNAHQQWIPSLNVVTDLTLACRSRVQL